MDLRPTDEQLMLRHSLKGLLSAQRERPPLPGKSEDAEHWKALAELGLLGLPFEEEYGGSDGRPVDLMLAMEELGGALASDTYFTTIVQAGTAIRVAGTLPQRAALLPPIVEGRLRLNYVGVEQDWPDAAPSSSITAAPSGESWTLAGRASSVLNVAAALPIVVLARCATLGGFGLFMVEASAVGVKTDTWVGRDRRNYADMTFRDVSVPADGIIGFPDALALEALASTMLAARCAEALGSMEQAITLTREHLSTRKQFGVNLGSFQGLQHRFVDMVVAAEEARGMILFGALSLDEGDRAGRLGAIAAMAAHVARASRYISQQAIQLHGAIGLTMDYALSGHVLRLAQFEATVGMVDRHLAHLSALGGLYPTAMDGLQ